MPIVERVLHLDLSPAEIALLQAGHGPTMLAAMGRIGVHVFGAPNREDVLAIMAEALALDRLAIIAANEAISEDCAEIARRIEMLLPPGEREVLP